VILSGGEALLDPLRFEVTYKVVERLTAKYAGRGGVKIVVQTTGDLLDERIVTDLLERGVYMISVAGLTTTTWEWKGRRNSAALWTI